MKVLYKDKEIELKDGMKVNELCKDDIQKAANAIMGCRVNNEVKPLNYALYDRAKLELIDYTNKDGKRIYVRGLLFVMGKAFSELYPDALLTVDYQLDNANLYLS